MNNFDKTSFSERSKIPIDASRTCPICPIVLLPPARRSLGVPSCMRNINHPVNSSSSAANPQFGDYIINFLSSHRYGSAEERNLRLFLVYFGQCISQSSILPQFLLSPLGSLAGGNNFAGREEPETCEEFVCSLHPRRECAFQADLRRRRR